MVQTMSKDMSKNVIAENTTVSETYAREKKSVFHLWGFKIYS